MLVGPRKCLKRIIQITLNKVKNLNWPETNQLAIYKRGRPAFELTNPASGLALGASELQVRSNALTTLPCCQHCWMLHVASVCTPCCIMMLLRKV